MPGLIPSSRLGKPGRKGLVPSRGCVEGTVIPWTTCEQFIAWIAANRPLVALDITGQIINTSPANCDNCSSVDTTEHSLPFISASNITARYEEQTAGEGIVCTGDQFAEDFMRRQVQISCTPSGTVGSTISASISYRKVGSFTGLIASWAEDYTFAELSAGVESGTPFELPPVGTTTGCEFSGSTALVTI